MLAWAPRYIRMAFIILSCSQIGALSLRLSSRLLSQVLSRVDISRNAKLGIAIAIWIGASVSLYFLLLGVEALVCVIASNVDGSDLLS